MAATKRIWVDVSALPIAENDAYGKLFPIFKTRVEERSNASVTEGRGDFTVFFAIDAEMADEAFDISDTDGGIVIKGKNFNSLMFGMGHLLHKSRYTEEGMSVTDWRGYSAPTCSFRVIYFAAHFYNWYQNTSMENLTRYFEDLMLWGYNGICSITGKLNMEGPDDPNYEKAIQMAEKLFRTAKSIGMKTATMFGNVDFKNRNPAVAADTSKIFSKTGNLICPSCKGGYEYIYESAMRTLPRFCAIGLDYYIFFPYDEGGCSCELCAPWGGNGYYRMAKRLFFDFKKMNPDAKSILTHWHFNLGINDKRDFPWLDKAIRDDKYCGCDWVDYMMLETRNGIPQYIKDNGIPGGCDAIDFPEITMLKLDPWGAYGAVCTPSTIKELWSTVGPMVKGGLPYSEGKFDDLNKALIAGLFWDSSRPAEEIFKDYCGYEFREEIADDLWKICLSFEENQFRTYHAVKKPADMAQVTEARELAVKLDASLPESIRNKWQWRLFYIRAVLDYERYAAAAETGWDFSTLMSATRFEFWGKLMRGSRLAQKLLYELLEMYEMPEVHDPKKHYGHFMVRPPYTPIIENFESFYDKNK